MAAIKGLVSVAALALVVSGCGDADGSETTTDPSAGGETTTPESTRSPSPSEPGRSPDPAETTPPADSPSPAQSDDPGSDDTAAPVGPAGEPSTDLVVEFDPGLGEVVEWTISCDPVGGSMRDAAAGCETLESIGPQDVGPVSKDARCTMQYGGPQTARITGTWDGKKVDLRFSRENGCEIARWDAMAPVLPAGSGDLL